MKVRPMIVIFSSHLYERWWSFGFSSWPQLLLFILSIPAHKLFFPAMILKESTLSDVGTWSYYFKCDYYGTLLYFNYSHFCSFYWSCRAAYFRSFRYFIMLTSSLCFVLFPPQTTATKSVCIGKKRSYGNKEDSHINQRCS